MLGKTVQLKSTERPRPPKPRFIYVKLFGYPLDIDPEILSKSIGVYGELLEIRDDINHTINIKTGVKTARFASLKEAMPSFIYAGRYHIRTAYQGQPKTYRNCSKTGHIAKDCTAGKVCRTCGEPDHNKGDCPERRCFYCKGHEQVNCGKYQIDFPSVINGKQETESSNIVEDSQNHFDPPQSTEWGVTMKTGGPRTANNKPQHGYGNAHLTPLREPPGRRRNRTQPHRTQQPGPWNPQS